MKYQFPRLFGYFIFLVFVSIILACSKDTDILSDAKFELQQQETTQTSDTDSTSEESETESETDETPAEEETPPPPPDPPMEDNFESRTTDFSPLDDVHVQSGKGYNQQILRLNEGTRVSFMKFDLSPIDSIGGYITDARLYFTVNSDEGNGTVNVFKGLNNNWTETNIVANEAAPEVDLLLGAIVDEFSIGDTEEVVLSSADMIPEWTTLVLLHENGNDLAIASKEHPTGSGPLLKVTYNVPIDAPEIVLTEESDVEPPTEEAPEAGNQAPMAIADASPASGGAPLVVTFSGGNSTDDNGIASYLWDFANGSTSNEVNPVHTFNTVGSYEVSLTVTDGSGLTSTDTVTITVNEESNAAPVAVASATPTSGTAPLTVNFTGSGSTDDQAVTSYVWNYGNGEASSAPNPEYTFQNPGVYNVILTVRDENGLEDSAAVAITVNEPASGNEAPVAVATATPTVGDAPLVVNFTGSNSTDDSGIASYYWNFPGDPSSASNATRTFNTPGVYDISLTVTDNEGLTNTATVTITVNQGSGGGNTGGGGGTPPPPGYYVTTYGSPYSNGLSEATAWNIEHAFAVAQPGDVIYVKAGNYGNVNLSVPDKPNSSAANPTKIIGYTNVPGDLVSYGGSTHTYGSALDPNKMPLLQAYNYQGVAIDIFEQFVHLENFQITGYSKGIQSIVPNFTGKNIIVTHMGNQNVYTAYDGFGIDIRGAYSVLENCFVYNATAQAITLTNADYSHVLNCSVYADNPGNPTDYYYLVAGGTNNAVVENSYAERGIGLQHGGHGFNMKNDATYNTFKNCVARRTSFEFTYSGVHHNTIDGGAIYGVARQVNYWQARLSFIGAANNNTVRNFRIEDTWNAIAWTIYDDTTGSEAQLAKNNYFDNVTVVNAHSGVSVGGGTNFGALAANNTFNNCTFQDFGAVVRTYYMTQNIVFQNSTFTNGDDLVVEAGGQYAPYDDFNGSWINNTWINVNFNPPN